MEYKNYLSILATGAVMSIMMASCKNETKQYEASPAEVMELSAKNEIIRGKYLVGIMGCNDCHSPKKMGENGPELIPELLLSGYPADRPIVNFDSDLIKEGFGIFYPDLTAAAGPWGVSFAGNLTPDETGIGNWSEEQFKTAFPVSFLTSDFRQSRIISCFVKFRKCRRSRHFLYGIINPMPVRTASKSECGCHIIFFVLDLYGTIWKEQLPEPSFFRNIVLANMSPLIFLKH